MEHDAPYGELALTCPDGQIVPVTITVSLVRSPDSEVMYELAVVAER